MHSLRKSVLLATSGRVHRRQNTRHKPRTITFGQKMRMKRQFIFLFTIISFCCSAQSRIGLHFGPSQPLSDFGSRNADNDDAGFAKTGFNIAVNYQTLISSSLGFHGEISRSSWGFSARDFRDGASGISIGSTAWKALGFWAGAFKSYTSEKQLTVNFGADLGVVVARNPRLTVKYDWGGLSYVRRSASTGALALKAFADFEYPVPSFDNFLFNFNISIATLQPEFRKVRVEHSFSTDRITFSQSMLHVNFGIGLKYLLAGKE